MVVACGLYILLTVRPAVIGLAHLLLGAFGIHVSTGLRPLACRARTP